MSDKLRFGEMLVRAGVLGQEDLDRVLREVESEDTDLGEVLVARGLVPEQVMLQTLSKSLNRPCVGLDKVAPDPRAVELVPRETCVRYHLLPVEIEKSARGEHLHVAMANPADVTAIKAITRQTRMRISPLVASAREIHRAIAIAYGGAPIPAVQVATPQASAPSAVAPQQPAAPPAPSQPSSAPAGEAGGMFDFGVMDLSAYEAPEAEAPSLSPSAPPAPLAPDPVPDLSGPLLGLPDQRPVSQPTLGADLMEALDSGGLDSMLSTSDMGSLAPHAAPPAAGDAGGFGVVRRKARNPEPEAASRSIPKEPPLPGRGGGSGRKPLPPLPPGLRGPRSPSPAEAEPILAAPPGDVGLMETQMGAPALSFPQTPSSPPSPEPAGLVDDPDRSGLKGILDRYVNDDDSVDAEDDTVIAQAANKYGAGTSSVPPGQDPLLAMRRLLGRHPERASHLLIALVDHLGRRGLVDLEELRRELERMSG